MSSLHIIYDHVKSKGDVFEVIEEVSDSNAGENHIDGVPHVPVGEHQDVGEVEQGAKNANQHGKPAVDRVVKILWNFIILYDGRELKQSYTSNAWRSQRALSKLVLLELTFISAAKEFLLASRSS